MKIALASDHAGYQLKREVAALLEADGHKTVDYGPDNEDPCDLPDFVYPAALGVARGDAECGIFVDGVGYGSAMIANKVYGVYAAVAQDPFCASLARSHSNTNVLCIGGKIIGSALAIEVVKAWMNTEWLTDEKYRRRVQKVVDINDRHLVPLGLMDPPAE